MILNQQNSLSQLFEGLGESEEESCVLEQIYQNIIDLC